MKADLVIPRLAAARKATGIQYAALPYRLVGGTPEILLVTSRRTRRWIVPKGWPIDGLQPPDCAAVEALEEAGVCGEICEVSVGHYRYVKHSKKGFSVPCSVEVFAMHVTQQRKSWAEKSERERRWHTVAAAAAAVEEPMLRLVILRFGEQIAASRPS